LGLGLVLFALSAFSVREKPGAVEGTVERIDAAAKTVVVKTVDGAEHAFHFTERTAVHGAEATAAGGKATLHGLEEGSHVVVHYTAKGTDKTAHEIDNVGKSGLKVTEGTVENLDHAGKTMTIKTANGAEQTFRVASHATQDAGNDISQGAQKSAHVTVYYSEQAGHKVVHFVKKSL
jgi:arginine repressor